MLLLILSTSLFLHWGFCCAPDEFQCRDKTCITQKFRCDNFADCKDGSDEIGCVTRGCKPYEFRCQNGMCISSEFRCDNFEDCKDGSDEIGCEAALRQSRCSGSCEEPTLIYTDLRCKPAMNSSSGKCCPSAFDCLHIEERGNLVEEKCHFNGKTYGLGDVIANTEVYGSCSSNCICQKTSLGYLAFECKTLKCQEWFYQNKKPGCHHKYELGKCCSTGQLCEPIYSTCKVKEKTYYEGQRFESPTEKCTFCVCKAGSSVCSKYQCIQEIKFHHEVMNFCAPSYLTMDDCCPINWICPRNDKIIISKAAQKPKARCRFGNLFLHVGDKFKRVHKPNGGKLLCECRIPPYLTCLQDYLFPIQKV